MTKSIAVIAKEFEDDVRLVLDGYIRRNPTAYLRLYDTRSAGNFLPSQPGDFVAVLEGKATLIECKASEKHDTMVGNRTLLTKNFSDGQVAYMRVWHRAGANTIVLFLSANFDIIEVWSGNHLAETYVTPKAKPEVPLATFHRKELATHLINYMR